MRLVTPVNTGSWAAFNNQVQGGVGVSRGGRATISGSIVGQKTENGWKIEIGASRLVSGPTASSASTAPSKAQVAPGSVPPATAPTGPSNPVAVDPAVDLVKSGRAKAAQGDYAAAIANFTKAIELTPNFMTDYKDRGVAMTAYNDRSVAKYNLKDFHGAIEDSTQAIQLGPTQAIFYDNRGNAKRILNDYVGAIADYTRAIELNNTNEVTYGHRALAKFQNNDYDGAIADYTRSIELDPKYEAMYVSRANTKYRLKDYYGAVADYTQAIALDPTSEASYNGRALARFQLHQYDGAVADFTCVIELNPKSKAVYGVRATAKYRLKDYNGAIADYTQAIEVGAGTAVLYENRGNVKRDLNDYTGAIADYIKSFDLQSNATPTNTWSPAIRRFLEGALSEAELFNRASTAESVSTRQKQVCQADYYAGIKRLLVGDKGGALVLFTKCVETTQSNQVAFMGAEMELKALKSEEPKSR